MAAGKHDNERNDPKFIFADSLIIIEIIFFFACQFLIDIFLIKYKRGWKVRNSLRSYNTASGRSLRMLRLTLASWGLLEEAKLPLRIADTVCSFAAPCRVRGLGISFPCLTRDRWRTTGIGNPKRTLRVLWKASAGERPRRGKTERKRKSVVWA